MSLRRPFAAVLQLLRTSKNLQQQTLSGEIGQSYVSLLEASRSTASIDVTQTLAKALELNPATFFGLVIAADQQQTPRSVMLAAIAEMEALGVADTILPSHPKKLEAPNVSKSKNRKKQIQGLKAQGLSRAEVAREIGCSWMTVSRLWSDETID
jgi:transcriptional regulator with XRE-family HTH domain